MNIFPAMSEIPTRISPERLKGDPSPQPNYPIRITIPAKVAYNMDALQKSIVNIAEAIGCRTCFSGADCFFEMTRDFVIDPANLQVKERVLG